MTVDEALEAAGKTQAAQAQEDQAGAEAASEATPGQMREAFSAVPDIKVGPFTVRRFRDGDFISLEHLGHPMKNFRSVTDESYKFEPSGMDAWTLCWVMTRPAKEVKEALATGGVDVAKTLAEE